MSDYLAKHYIVRPTGHYRIKVFQQSVGIERQSPRDMNLLFKRAEYPVWDAEARYPMAEWKLKEIDRLVVAYEQAIAHMEAENE